MSASNSTRPTRILPSADTVRYVRRLFRLRYRIPAADIDDVVSDAYLSLLRAEPTNLRDPDGLFVVVARRRAIDYQRLSIAQRARPWNMVPGHHQVDMSKLEEEQIVQELLRFVGENRSPDPDRLRELLTNILDGLPFGSACRAIGIPRGSRQRYLHALRRCFRRHLGQINGCGRSQPALRSHENA